MAAAIRLNEQHSCSLDHLVGTGEQRRRHRETENLCSLKIYNQLELGRLHYRQVRRLRALEDAPGVDPDLSISISQARSVADQAPCLKAGKPLNIREGLAPAFESRPSLIQPVDCISVPGNENLFLMPGHIGLAEYEVTLGIAQELSGFLVTLRNLPGSLRYLIDATAVKYNIDIVMIDMSPSLGAVNQNLLSTSNYFIVPMHPDYFSKMAINSLASVFPKWRAWAMAADQISVLKEAEYPLPSSDPKFLGYVVQKYRPRAGAPSKAFQKWVEQLEAGVAETLIPALERCVVGYVIDSLLASRLSAEARGFRQDLRI